MNTIDPKQLEDILGRAVAVAKEYYQLTGKPLGITGEIGEYWVSKYLNIPLEGPRSPGYDAIHPTSQEKIQIKSRAVANLNKLGGQKIGRIQLETRWDKIYLVIMDQSFELHGIYSLDRTVIESLLTKTQSKARERGQLSASEFIKHGKTKIEWQKPAQD